MVDKLQEYLVALGFDVNQPSYRHFADILTESESMARRTGEAALGVGFAVEAMVAKIAAQQEHLYFVAQRTGTSVQALQAYEFGMTQIGVSADAARSSVEGFAMAIRNNPGLAGLARSLGVTELTDSHKMQMQLVNRLRHMPDFVAMQFAGMFGMDQQTYINLKNNYETEKKQEEEFLQRQREAGVGTRKASDEFRHFSMSLRTVEGDFSILEQRLGLDWVQPATRVLDFLDKLIRAFNNMDESTRKWIVSLLTLYGAVKSIGILGGIARKLGIIGGGTAAATGGTAAAASATTAALLRSGARKGVLATLALAGVAAARQDSEHGYALRDQIRDMLGLAPLEGWDRFGPVLSGQAHWPHGLHRSSPAQAVMGSIVGLPIKKGAGRISPQAQAIIMALAGLPGLNQVTAADDAYHRHFGRGQHPLGNALDITINDRNQSPQMAAAVAQRLAAAGIHAKVLDEYAHPSPHATGGHLHIQLDAKTTINVHGDNSADTARHVASHQKDVNGDLAGQLSRRLAGSVI